MSYPFDIASTIAAQRRHLADALRPLEAEARLEKVTQTCIETGGCLILPDTSGSWGPLHAELHMMGLYHSGNSADEAIANWIKAAQRCTPVPPARVT
ncbi:hypothetical protein [Pseudosulfitobacter pseudonitzschiae]|uniref:hypothetical protein n=1 Tax=Pseudosulfitobacter pseudonitzschiae TaxID=1402135 RepID=UPI003B75EAC2